jgi:gliding motility-associated-like protein
MKMLSPMGKVLLLAICFLTKLSFSQLTISNQGGSLNAIFSEFIGNGLIISNPVINCPSNAYGTYSGGTPFNLSNGLVLTTGNANQVASPESFFMSTSNGTTCNDPQLISLEPTATNDCCILEFDVIPQCDELSIRFVFGSEEYPDFVNQSFNDAFGFFITGPRPSGGNYNNQNIAVVTGTTICSIDNVNASSNSSFYVNNSGGTTLPFGGYTTAITATLAVTPCQSYHFKMAIADASDDMYDSGVFIDLFECSSLISASLVATADNCATNSGSATVTVNNGLGPLSYNWSPAPGAGQGTTTASGLTAGVAYTCTVSDTYACIPDTTATIIIPGNPIPTTVASSNSPICSGTALNLTASNSGVSGSTYAWTGPNGFSSNVQNPVLTGATTSASGTYTVTVTANGCSSSSNVNVTVSPVPVIDPLASLTQCAGTVVSASNYTTTPSGASFTWTNNNTNTGIAANGTGNIASFTASNATTSTQVSTITVTPTIGMCVGTATNYTITVNPIPTTVASSNSPICSGTALNLTASNSGVSGSTYAWTGPNGFSSNVQNPVLTGATTAASGTYTVTVTANGCSSSSNVNVTVSPVPVIDPLASLTQCAGTVVSASNYTTTPSGASFTWTNNNTNTGIAANGTGNIASFTASNATTSTQVSTITVTPTIGICVGTATNYTITVNPIPTVNPVPNRSECTGSNIPSEVFGSVPVGASYIWSNDNTSIGLGANGNGNAPSFTTTNTTSGVLVGNVSVIPTLNGCVGNPVSYSISVKPIPVLDPISDITACAGTTVSASTFSSNPTGSTFTWLNDNTAIGLGAGGSNDYSSFSAINGGSAPISSNVTVTPLLAGCTGSDLVYAINVNPTPQVIVNSPTICAGDTAILIASGATNYLWDSGETTSSIEVNPVLTSGFTVTGTSLGCSSTATSTVTVESDISLTVNSPSICEGQTVTLIVDGASSYLWENGEVTNSISVNPSATTTYNVTGTTGSCSGNTVATVTVNPLPIIDPVSSIEVCAGTLVSSPGLLLSSDDITYEWSNTNSSIGLEGVGVDFIPAFIGINSTQNPVSGLITILPTLNGCEGTPVSFQITINPIANASFSLVSYCEGQSIAPTVTGDEGGIFSFVGTVVDGASIDPATGLISNGIGGTTYTIEYLIDGACADSSIQQVSLYPHPDAPLVDGDGTYCHNTQPELIVVSGGNGQFTWYEDASLNTPIYEGANFSPESLVEGDNYFYVTENQNGCVSQATMILIQIENCTISIPTAFTPNNDGMNDQWEIDNLDLYFPKNKVVIYNRWGSIIFQSEEGKYSLKPWDGNYNGEPMPVASYYFIIDFNDGKTETETGTVSIIKK